MSENPPHLGDDFEVLARLVEWLQAGESAALVTVLRTWGSSPRPPGSLLAIRKRDGRMAGSVSGGCVEADLVERYRRGELDGFPSIVDYGVAAGDLLVRQVCLDSGDVSLAAADPGPGFGYLPPTVRKVFGPRWGLVLVGAGQLADHLARMALSLGFHVLLCDPRSGFDTAVDGVRLTREMPDDVVAGIAQAPRTAVVTLAHDPKLDDLALLEALPRDFFYVGALGSLRSAAARRERLAGFSIGEERLARLHAPVGLDIGSHTPAEIALSIAAELVAARNGVALERRVPTVSGGKGRLCV